MQTRFSPEMLADPAVQSSEAIIRKCVHCGFCTATCPTYVLLGDELDSPRGRIYLIKDMLENEREPSSEVVKHIDRCLSCLSCMTTCPSGVDYMHLVDHARAYINDRYRRHPMDRLVRAILAWTLPYPRRFRAALQLARLARPLAPALDAVRGLRPFAAMLRLAPAALPARGQASRARGHARKVAVLAGCAEPVLMPEVRAATVRLLDRIGVEVVDVEGEGCCGALVHHMGREADGLASARRNVDAWLRAVERDGIEAILVTASGCGTMIKDYGHMLRNDPSYADKAARLSAMAFDISEFLLRRGLPEARAASMVVAYHAACSLQHGQKVTEAPKSLLIQAGFEVVTPQEAHLCCGSAGTYNILQPELAHQLGMRKAGNFDRLDAKVIASGNVGCAVQIGRLSQTPVVHTVELLDWATGGPVPQALRKVV